MARGAALAAAIVVSLLAVSGAGGADAQTPKRGGTLVFGTQGAPGGIREHACMNPLLARCTPEGRVPFAVYIAEKVLAGAFEARPDYTWRPTARLGRRSTRPSRRSRSPTRSDPRARWSDGVPVSAQDFVFTYRANVALKGRAVRRHARRAGTACAGHRRERRSGCVLRSRVRGLAWILFGIVLPAPRARGRGSARGPGSIESTTRRRAGRSGADPSSSSAGSRAAR